MEMVAGERGRVGASTVGGEEDRANDIVQARRRQATERNRPDLVPGTKGALAMIGETVAGERRGMGASTVGAKDPDRASDLVRTRCRQVMKRDRRDIAPGTKGALATVGETVAGERGRVEAAAVEGGGAEGGSKEGEKEGDRL